MGKVSKTGRNQEPPLRLVGAETGGRRLTFKVQRLEAQVGYAVGALTVWAAVFLNPPGTIPWLLALYAAAIGAWARGFQAQWAAAMAARGFLLQIGGALLLATPGMEGQNGPALLWLLGVSIGYAVLLPAAWAALVAVASLVAYAWGGIAHGADPWQITVALSAGLVALPAVAFQMGARLRSSEEQAESARVDQRTRLYNERGFFANGGELFDDCRAAGRPFTLVLLNGNDLRDAAELLGRRAANELFEQTVKGISAATPPGGLAARTDGAEFAVAMPGLTADKAEALLHQRLGRQPQVKVNFSGHEAAIVLDVVTAQAPPELHTLEDLYDRLHVQLRKRVGEVPTTIAATDRSGTSTLHGLLLQDPVVPQSQRPTLPMGLAPRRLVKKPRGGARTKPAPLGAQPR